MRILFVVLAEVAVIGVSAKRTDLVVVLENLTREGASLFEELSSRFFLDLLLFLLLVLDLA